MVDNTGLPVEQVIAQNVARPELDELEEAFQAAKEIWDEFAANHRRGVTADVKLARRRARVGSSEVGKALKDYRAVSVQVDKRNE